jgi:hypothetical protein
MKRKEKFAYSRKILMLRTLKLSTGRTDSVDCAVQVPHSQCSLRENPEFLQKLKPKNNTLKGNV